MEPALIVSLLGVLVVPALGYLLSKKDAAQEAEISALKTQVNLLFKKHDAVVVSIQNLQLQLAKEHYPKPELDQRFQSLETTFRSELRDLGSELRDLGGKLDNLANILLSHVAKEAPAK